MGFTLLGLDGTAEQSLPDAVAAAQGKPLGLVLGAEGPGLRERTLTTCDQIVKIPFSGDFGSLNVSNAAAIALFSAAQAG